MGAIAFRRRRAQFLFGLDSGNSPLQLTDLKASPKGNEKK